MALVTKPNPRRVRVAGSGTGSGGGLVTAKSSSAKSLPWKMVLRSTRPNVTLVAVPEFHCASNCVHSPAVDDGMKGEPMGEPSMRNVSWARLASSEDATHTENVYRVC